MIATRSRASRSIRRGRTRFELELAVRPSADHSTTRARSSRSNSGAIAGASARTSSLSVRSPTPSAPAISPPEQRVDRSPAASPAASPCEPPGKRITSCDRLPFGAEFALAQLRERAAQPRAGVRLADTEHACELCVGELAVELQQHDLRVARGRARERARARARRATSSAGRRAGCTRKLRGGLARRPPAPAPAQLVERRVAGDREEQPAGGSATGVDARAR